MVELIKLLLKFILHVDSGLRDNTRLAGSILIGGAWVILSALVFPRQLGEWRNWFYWGGWGLVGLALFLVARRRIWEWRGRPAKQSTSLFIR
jgi:hypothetical protein